MCCFFVFCFFLHQHIHLEEETQPVKALETSLQTDALDIIAVIAADFGSLGFCLKTKNTKSWKLNEKGKVPLVCLSE